MFYLPCTRNNNNRCANPICICVNFGGVSRIGVLFPPYSSLSHKKLGTSDTTHYEREPQTQQATVDFPPSNKWSMMFRQANNESFSFGCCPSSAPRCRRRLLLLTQLTLVPVVIIIPLERLVWRGGWMTRGHGSTGLC